MDNEQNYYTVTFRNYPNYEQYVYGDTALDAIDNAADELMQQGYSTPFLAPRVRRTAYAEWKYDTSRYRNDGSFIK
jgi:hypothetical protein